MKRWSYAAALLPFALAACDDGTGPEDRVPVQIAFTTKASATSSVAPASLAGASAQEQLVVEGVNGRLVISDIRLIVAEFELEGPDACAVTDEEGETELEECEFEAPPSLLDLPLDTRLAVVATGAVPPGTYTELEYSIEDLDVDDDDEVVTRQGIQNIRNELLRLFPGFPAEASMVVVGTFTPTGGEARPFTVFVDADIEVEVELNPPLVIPDVGAPSRTLTVNLDPALWFQQAGQVLDLSGFDGKLIELDVEQGMEVEVEDDD